MDQLRAEVGRLADAQVAAANEVLRLQRENQQIGQRLLTQAAPDPAASTAAAVAAAMAAVAAQPRTIVDTKGIAKPKDFENDEKKWAEFSFKYENWLSAVFPDARL